MNTATNSTASLLAFAHSNVMGREVVITKGQNKGAHGIVRWVGVSNDSIRVGVAVEGRSGLIFCPGMSTTEAPKGM